MVLGWIDLVQRRLSRHNEFVSADAKSMSTDPRHYEILTPTIGNLGTTTTITSLANRASSPQAAATSPGSLRATSPTYGGDQKTDHPGREAKYVSPSNSFSTPRLPNAIGNRGRDKTATFSSIERSTEVLRE